MKLTFFIQPTVSFVSFIATLSFKYDLQNSATPIINARLNEGKTRGKYENDMADLRNYKECLDSPTD